MGIFNKQKYDTEYAKEHYDRCIFNVPKGKKEIIEQHRKAKGYKSLNAYVNDLIDRDMDSEKKNSTNIIVGRDNN